MKISIVFITLITITSCAVGPRAHIQSDTLLHHTIAPASRIFIIPPKRDTIEYENAIIYLNDALRQLGYHISETAGNADYRLSVRLANRRERQEVTEFETIRKTNRRGGTFEKTVPKTMTKKIKSSAVILYLEDVRNRKHVWKGKSSMPTNDMRLNMDKAISALLAHFGENYLGDVKISKY